MAFSLGALVFSLRSDSAELRKDMKQSKGIVTEAMEEMRKSAELARTALELVGIGLGIHEIAEAVSQYGEMADELGKISELSGISTASLQGLKFAAEQNDTEFESLTQGLRKLRIAQVEGANGNTELLQQFLKLGIGIQDLQTLKPEELFLRVADGVRALGDESEITAALTKTMGKSADDLGVLMRQGADGIREAMEESREFGKVLDDETIEAIKQSKDNLDALKTSGVAVANALAESLAPATERITTAMRLAAKEGGVLEALWVGLGGVAAETFDLNDTRLEQINSDIERLSSLVDTREVAHERFKAGLFNYFGFGNEVIEQGAKDIAELRRQLQSAIDARDELLKSKVEEKPVTAGFAGVDLAAITAGAETGIAAIKKQIDAAISQADANEKVVQGLQAQAAALGQNEGAAELYKLKINGATAAQLALAKAAIDARAAFADQQEALQKSSDDFERWTALRAEAMTAEEAATMRLIDRWRELDEIVVRHPELATAAADTKAKLQQQALKEQDQAMEAQLKQQKDERDATLRHRAELGDLEAEQEIRSREFSELTARGKTKYVLGQMASLTAGASQYSRAAFEANKAVSTATAIMNTYEMATGAYKALAPIPIVGPALGAAAAAAALAFGFMQVQAIQATSFSGGGAGTSPSAVASTPVVNGNPVASGTASFGGTQDAVPTTQIIIQGNLYSNDAERMLADLKALINDGDPVLIENYSRNAAELRAA